MPSEFLEFVGTLPDWLSAIGTISAVIVALHLARRDNKIRPVGNATIYVLLERGNPVTDKYVAFTVTNIGVRTFVLTGISWRSGIFKKRHFFVIPPPNALSTSLPAKLADGDQAAIYIPLVDFRHHSLPAILENRPKTLSWIWYRSQHMIVHASTGDSYDFKIHRSLRDEISGKGRPEDARGDGD